MLVVTLTARVDHITMTGESATPHMSARPNQRFLGKAAAAICCSLLTAAGCTAQARSNSAAPVLLELFTSEGCSSCPPADALLKQLGDTKTASGQMLIALSEHVTYWNQLGWADPFSNDTVTDRQSAYGQHFHLDSVYTPQLVINGRDQVVGSDRSGALRAIASQREPARVALTISTAVRTPAGVAVTYSASAPAQLGNAQLFAAVADDMDQSSVLRGENGGRTLNHVAVVRSLTSVGPVHATSSGRLTVAAPDVKPGRRQHLVLFAQEPGPGAVLGISELPIAQP